MEKPNQLPGPECCLTKGGEAQECIHAQTEQLAGSVHREKHEPQAGPASRQSNTASRTRNADGQDVWRSEANTEGTAKGEVPEGLPGSMCVARAEEVSRNWGGPEFSRRTNCESQAGKEPQRQGGATEGIQGVGSANISPRQDASPEAGQGADTITKPAQDPGAVRMTEERWHTFLRGIAEKAIEQPGYRFKDLYRRLNQDTLRLSFYLLRKDAASGVDGVTYKEYEKNLEGNLSDLVSRLKCKGYRAKPVKRKYIPKGNGKQRPLGIPALEDKLLQVAATQILTAIYEMDFLDCSYGYRRGRGPHQAVRVLTDELQWGKHNFVVEADIKGFFEHIGQEHLTRMLGERINDGAFLGLIRKWLRAGILEEDGKVIYPATGTPQGGIISPVLANVYLHHVLDRWFEDRVRQANRGKCRFFRYADDFVACFEYRHEAVAFEQALKERLREYGLEVAEEKTKMLRFGRNGGPHNGRFDFLGFEIYWEKDRKGRPTVKRRTATKKWRAGIKTMRQWIKSNRHQPVKKLLKKLSSKLRGTWRYYGIIGNSRSMNRFYYETKRELYKWLNRRSQKRSYTWRVFARLLERHQVPPPRIWEISKSKMPCQLELSLCQRIAPFFRRVSEKVAYAKAS